MAGKGSDYHRGEMDIHEQASTYHAFLVLAKWGSLAIITGVLWAALTFCTTVGFINAVISSFVLLVLGVVLLREKKKTGH